MNTFDERPIKRQKQQQSDVDEDLSAITKKIVTGFSSASMTQSTTDTISLIIKYVEQLCDSSPALDAAMSGLDEIYYGLAQKLISGMYINTRSGGAESQMNGNPKNSLYVSNANINKHNGNSISGSRKGARHPLPNSMYNRNIQMGTDDAYKKFENEYRLLAQLFNSKRPRTWEKAVGIIVKITKLVTRTSESTLTQCSENHKLPRVLSEDVCRDTVRSAWKALLGELEYEWGLVNDTNTPRSLTWIPCLESTHKLLDCYLGRDDEKLNSYLISHFALSRDLDPGIAVSESGVLSREMQTIVDLCVGRKRRLGRILFPPDASWPLISHASRSHTVKHIYDQPQYSCVRETLTWEEIEQGPSADKYVSDLLFQRASMDEVLSASYNHSTIKKEIVEAALRRNHIYFGNQLSRLRESISQHATDSRELLSKVLLEAIVKKVSDVVDHIRSVCDFQTSRTSPDSAIMVVPKNIQYWELMNEVADQIYSLVGNGYITYLDIHKEFKELSFPKDWDIIPPYTPKNDNAYTWLLLQIISIDCNICTAFKEDLSGDEKLLEDLFTMYNPQQTMSKDAFYLRDLSINSLTQTLWDHIQDRSGLKYRQPNMQAIMSISKAAVPISNHRKALLSKKPYNADKFTLSESLIIGFIAQFQSNNSLQILYSMLVPSDKYSVGTLPNPSTKYLIGEKLDYKMLDYLNVNCKNRFLKAIYKDMFDHENGIQFQGAVKAEHEKLNAVNCVSPYVIDTVYRLLYNAPYTNELMMKEVLEKLRRCDQAMATQGDKLHFSFQVLRWLYTIYQLMNCRLLRFFKYYAHASHLIHHLRHSLVHIKHPQLYRSVECFALCLVNLQHEVEFLQALLNPEYHGIPLNKSPTLDKNPKQPINYCKPKEPWFECEMLSRNAVMVISRIILMRGLGDARGLSPSDFLESLSASPAHWDPSALRYMPAPIRKYYNSIKTRSLSFPNPNAVRSDIQAAYAHHTSNNGNSGGGASFNATFFSPDSKGQDIGMLISYYSQPDNQPTFLCVLWEVFKTPIINNDRNLAYLLSLARRIILGFPLSRLANYTATLIDYIVYGITKGNNTSASEADQNTKSLLDDFTWKFQLVRHEHILYALSRGEHDLRTDNVRCDLIRYIILDSPPFVDRLNEWHSLNFLGRYWTDSDHQAKQDAYLKKFPEFFEYEGYLSLKGVPMHPPPSLPLPAYYENGMGRLLPVLEFSLGRIIEAERRDLLIDICDRMGILFRLHQVPLTTLMNTLFVYFGSPVIHDSRALRSMILSLLDMSQQGFTEEFEQFVHNKVNDDSHIGDSYILQVMERVTRIISRHIDPPIKPNLPETHYREIPNPVLLCLTECAVEVLTWWCLSRCGDSVSQLPANRKHARTESEFLEEEHARRIHGENWRIGKRWLQIVLEPKGMVDRLTCKPVSYMHATGLFANVLPDDLMTFPIVRHLYTIITEEKLLKVFSGPKVFFSFVQLTQSGYKPGIAAGSTVFASSIAFDSFDRNYARGTTNVPNSYLVVLHSVFHYGGIGAFTALSETVHKIATEGELTTDIQLLYMCAVVGPILYRLDAHRETMVPILCDLFSILARILPNIRINAKESTDAIEQIVDFFHFVKEKFDPGPALWNKAAKLIPSFPQPLIPRFYGLLSPGSTGTT
ncbi:hypothetical protein H4219_000301 [Mycoemilia scoparia]|uniref:Mediator of RNA polymerase II transcription subunit 23 n=1 Tax=Mycoemilia scoparia TaxID=417184 RepID=A0A9W8DX49_9FUNG|nr:hypothetical protein H4219_000301 [Mycoemilia scoparia]